MSSIGESAALEETPFFPESSEDVTKSPGCGAEGFDAASGEKEVYVCDLSPSLLEGEIRALLGRYGEIRNLETVVGDSNGLNSAVGANVEGNDVEAAEAAVLCEYVACKVAAEAREMLNNASVRGRTIRCIFVSDLETMRQTMCGGHRLFVDGIDATLETRGLLDVASLCGDVLDCKVEPVNGSAERQTAVGFVHYAKLEASNKARTLLSGMQIGEATLTVRPFVAKDLDVFTGCLYAAGCFDEQVDIDEPSQAANGVEGAVASSSMNAGSSNGDGHASQPSVVATSPVFATDADELEALEHFKALQYHSMEVCADRRSKLVRLQELVTLYSPNHEQQMIITACADSLEEITSILSETFDDYDFAVVGECACLEDRTAIAREFDIGNIYVLVMDEAVFSNTSIGVTEPSAVFVAFDLPETVQEYLSEIWVYTRPHTSRIHSFFSPGVNTALCGPILALMEEADLEINPKLLELLGDGPSK